jgi:hypothetical protein
MNPKEFHEMVRRNPHIEQIGQYGYTVKFNKILPRIMPFNASGMGYRRRNQDLKTVIHWGQRKLLISEIEFLTNWSEPGDIVIYAGAAPGNHTYFLSLLFPQLKFVLVDPTPFYCIPTDRIEIRNEYFTDTIAKEYSGLRTLFISDIRTACWELMNKDEIEQAVKNDMESQQRWHLIMKPKKSMFKFRLPWKSGVTEYLDGKIHYPVWGPCTTTEARLVVDGNVKKKYDNSVYEKQMFYFNVVTRTQLYHHPVEGYDIGLDHCYDCAAEVKILTEYLKKYPLIWENASQKMMKIFAVRDEELDPQFDPELDNNIDPDQHVQMTIPTLSQEEKNLMMQIEPWETNLELCKFTQITTDPELIKKMVIIVNSMCSKGRTLMSKLGPVGSRKWFPPKKYFVL